jgi:hypothetical protein
MWITSAGLGRVVHRFLAVVDNLIAYLPGFIYIYQYDI